MKRIYDFLKKAGVYYLGTVENNKPKIRPFGTIDIYNDRLTIQTGLKKDVAKQMINNPNISICAFNEGQWIRVDAEVKLDTSVEASTHMLSNYPDLKHMYVPGDGNCCVFVLTKGKATICSFIEAPVEIDF